MRMNMLAATVAVAALFPSMAFAQTCEQHSNRVVGTVAGGVIGAVVGGAVAGDDDRATGAVIGAVGGALIGNQLSRGNADCDHAYGYYDERGMWHANAVERNAAAGYYDRNGQWVDGAPNGYYDSRGRWIAATFEGDASGYYDSNGRWVPASANGYYDVDGQWIANAASGYYDANGRWVAGPTRGQYDANGRWISGAPGGHHDANGFWVADAQPGYYDNGRWVPGSASGFYDASGRWHATSAHAQGWQSINARQANLEQRIDAGERNGSLTRSEAVRLRADFRNLARLEARYRRNGLSSAERRDLDRRFDALSFRIRDERNDGSDRNWQPINQRQNMLDNRIDAGIRSGHLTRNEAMRLRAEFREIEQVEVRYRRNGLSYEERRDLDRRFDRLSAQLQAALNDNDRRRG